MSKYTVWVGGVEVNEDYVTYEQAQALALMYDDYDDVQIEEVKD